MPTRNQKIIMRNDPILTRVKQMIDSKMNQNLEMYRLDVSSSGSINIAGTMFPLTQGIVVGDTAFERSGEAITVKELDVHIKMTASNASTFRTAFARVIIFCDTMNNANTPSTADVITTTDTSACYADEVWKTKRVKILFDQVFNTGSINAASNKQIHRVIQVNRKVFYQGSTNVAASNGPNSLWMYVWSDDNTNTPLIQSNIKIKYHDA